MPYIFRRPRTWAIAALVILAAAGAVFFSAPRLPAADPYEAVRNRLVDEAIVAEGVKNKRVIESMRHTPRHEFMPESVRKQAYFDMAVPIGDAQTISPPFIVAYMTEQLDPQAEDKVLEIGTGSGYQAAVLSRLVKEVYTIEIVEALGKRAAATLKKLKYTNVQARVGDGFKGWAEAAPFDKIIVTCSPEDVPQPLVDQLKEGGRMIIPLGERYQQSLYLMTKKDGKMVSEALVPTMFVPMTGAAEAARKVKPDPKNPKLVNGDFETVDKSGRLDNWYYQRQLTLDEQKSPQGKRFVTFSNREAGRGAHALQAFPVDGSAVKTLKLSCFVKGTSLRAGGQGEIPALVVVYYDKDRKTVGHVSSGNFFGTFEWREFEDKIKVPEKAREAIIRIGLHGATGEISFDQISLEAGK